ncbi:MAG: FliA/WhiG family RNA polymerase sigma factor [Armatimonadetes bacterium]|nr:FliA/WhiG family RNA polymerase sigma factor [Armatimonadota bacterium]
MSNVKVEDIWRRYKQQADPKAREELINSYAYLVKITAGRVVANMPPNLDREDLHQSGIIGLIKAVDQFDASRNVKFETYAIALIRGAILETLREQDWVPRSIRDKVKNLERMHLQLESRLGRPPTEEEVASEMNMTLDQFYTLLSDACRATVVSLDDLLLTDAGDDIHFADVIQDNSVSPSAEVEWNLKRDALSEAIDRLPEREKHVIALYYQDGLTYKEIGLVLGVSESRVYQLYRQAVNKLRRRLSAQGSLFLP